MNSHRSTAKLLIPFLALAATLSVSAHSHPVFDKVVVFGDSLSDPGNLYALTGQQATAPYAPVPSAPYAIGGHHFSNGETWVERLATALAAPSGAGPAFAVPAVFTNYAVGGAEAASNRQIDLNAQFGLYLAASGGSADPQALYVIWIGGNDLRDALVLLQSNPKDPGPAMTIVQNAVGAVVSDAGTLASLGARSELIAGVPNLALLPAVRALGSDAQQAAQMLSVQYNDALSAALATLQGAYPQRLHIAYLDVYTLLTNVTTSPELYGLSNTVEPCLKFGTTTDPMCAAPNQYLFWDGIHPTRAGHVILARAALNAL